MREINKWQYDFILEIFGLFLSIKVRLNFIQLSRYSTHNELRYRNQFYKTFDFLRFNKELVAQHASKHLTIAFDLYYISKSGKHTSGLGNFWSGVAKKAKWGFRNIRYCRYRYRQPYRISLGSSSNPK